MPRQPRTGGSLLGVTAMAAGLGATGLATAGSAAAATPAQPPAPAPALSVPDTASEHVLSADPGLALAARIQQQADGQRTSVEETARLAAAQEAETKRAAQQAEVQAAAERDRLGTLELPTANYTLVAQAGPHWAHLNTGLDFAAPTGTPVTALGAGTVTSAGWSGAYGYRVIQTLPDGTEIWYCHLSAISAASGQVAAGTQLGKVGATGNCPGLLPGSAPIGPHLHLEVRPGGGAPVDPLAWLRSHGLQP
ncbi:hypothetical protein UK12_09695 [Saccharothrix sp. ST-888]|nr:hypothetical protein UK12_09695 [Saccharothrix sp. ST-888]